MLMQRKNFVVIMAAGSGSRMGASRPKQFLDLGGRMILQRTIEIFMEACPDITVVTVLPPDFIDFWRGHCLEQNFICPQITVPGGITRFHSVRNALQKVPDGAVVAVHDGVRPLASKKLIIKLILEAEKCGAVIPAVAPADSYRIVEGDDSRIIDRSQLRMIQTPQVFSAEVLRKAYEQPFSATFTDDASVVEAAGHKITLIEGERENINYHAFGYGHCRGNHSTKPE